MANVVLQLSTCNYFDSFILKNNQSFQIIIISVAPDYNAI